MSMSRKHSDKRAADMNMYQPEPEVQKSDHPSPAKRACEEIRRHTGVLERYLGQLELQEIEQERFDKLNESNAELVQKVSDLGIWLGMVKTALEHYDAGEMSARQFANEVDATIKGWESE